MRRGFAIGLAGMVVLLCVRIAGQSVPLEYSVKAAYLFNFVKFIDWPRPPASTGPLTICVAGQNPFGSTLAETIRGERVGERPIASRIIPEPEPGCDVVFVPRNSPASTFLKAAQTSPILTVGESSDFIAQGGIINFVLDAGNVRFEIDQESAQRVGLRISSRLLRLARPPEVKGQAR